MQSLTLLALAALASTVISVPTRWTPEEANFYGRTDKEIENLKAHGGVKQSFECDLSKVPLPKTSEPLPKAPDGQKLLAIAIGRGTQVRLSHIPGYAAEDPC